MQLSRRSLLRTAGAMAGATAATSWTAANGGDQGNRPQVVDTNVSFGRWPFRRLPWDDAAELVSKLRSLGVGEIWAGAYDGLLHRDLTSANRRLADRCRRQAARRPGEEFRCRAFGAIHWGFPGWERDARHCLSADPFGGVRIHPNYHDTTLADPSFVRLLRMAAEAGRLVQIAVAMEDPRTQHPRLRAADVDLTPLPAAMAEAPGARVQLLNARLRPAAARSLARTPGLLFDTARVDGTDGVPQLAGLAPGRVLFGSGAPLLVPEAAMIRVHESGTLSASELSDVFGRSAASTMGAG